MSVPAVHVPVRPFVTRVLEREGAAVEEVGEDALYVVLPGTLGEEVGLPPSGHLDLKPASAAGRHALPLEGAAMQALIDRARSRGRRAGVRLESPPWNPEGRLAKARARLVLPNTKCLGGEATRTTATRLLMEFGYDAQSEERTDGRIHVAVTAGGVASSRLAESLTAALAGATPEAPACGEAEIEAAVLRTGPWIDRDVHRRLADFREDCRIRMEVERDRIVAYHDRLAREARRGVRGRAAADEALAAKHEAILRQRAERLEDLAERHAVAAHYWLASVLVVRYEVGRCRLRLLRRRRGVEVDVEWDPFLGEFLGPLCAACGEATFYLHVCDAAGHVTCARCAGRCPRCARITCKACRSGGCKC